MASFSCHVPPERLLVPLWASCFPLCLSLYLLLSFFLHRKWEKKRQKIQGSHGSSKVHKEPFQSWRMREHGQTERKMELLRWLWSSEWRPPLKGVPLCKRYSWAQRHRIKKQPTERESSVGTAWPCARTPKRLQNTWRLSSASYCFFHCWDPLIEGGVVGGVIQGDLILPLSLFSRLS